MFGWKSSSDKQLALLRELIETQERFERRVKALEMDWESMYDKLRSILQRITKRAEVIEKAQTGPETPADAVAPERVSGRLLTPRQLQIQQQILRRRALNQSNGGEQ